MSRPELKDMFYALDLIESYGSGISRAKRAMAENGSPALVFTPDNETDDYTMATAYINANENSYRVGLHRSSSIYLQLRHDTRG